MNIRLFFLLFLGSTLLVSADYYYDIPQQQEDFKVFRNVLESKEGTLDLHLSSDSINLYLNKLGDDLSEEKTILEQFKLYSEMVVRLECGHTQVLADKTILAEWLNEKKDLPIDMYFIGRRLISGKIIPDDYENIRRTNTPNQTTQIIPKNSEILSIDSLTVPEMMSEMGKYIPSDEGSVYFKYHQSSELFPFYHHLALPITKDSVHVKYVTPKNDTNEVFLMPGKAPIHSMNARLLKSSQRYSKNESDMGKFKIVNGNYGYFKFHSFSASAGKDYNHFLKESFRELKRKKIDKLVIDLRGNTGGVMQYDFIKYFTGEGAFVGKYVITKPFEKKENQYIRKVTVSFLRYAVLSHQQKKALRKGSFDEGKIYTEAVDKELIYDGEVSVITDEGTFSSASILASQLKTLANAKIVGRPAGGSFYAGNAGSILLRLPQSKIQMSINPNTFYSHLDPQKDLNAIKQPDLYLDPNIVDEEERNQFYFKAAIGVFAN